MAKFLVIMEKGSENYSAYSPDLPGCIATGETVEETLENMRGAVEFHLEGIVENGEEIPIARSLASYLAETDEISADDILTSIEIAVPEAIHA